MEKNKISKLDNSYDYLTNMSFKQLTKTNLDKLNNKLKTLKTEKKEIEQLTNKSIWLNDLNELKTILI